MINVAAQSMASVSTTLPAIPATASLVHILFRAGRRAHAFDSDSATIMGIPIAATGHPTAIAIHTIHASQSTPIVAPITAPDTSAAVGQQHRQST